jgi:hypothetical protein
MKKKSDHGVLQYSCLKEFLTEFKITFFIILVSVSSIFASPVNAQMTNLTASLNNNTFEKGEDETVLTAEAVQNQITGTITDAATGEPMAGVNIQVKGTAIGSISGIDGRYSLPANVDRNATLVFSFIGYKTLEVEVNARNVVNVQLEAELTGLEEWW